MSKPTDESKPAKLPSANPEIHVRAVEARGGELIVTLEGQIRYQSAGDLNAFLTPLLAQHRPARLVLECGRISFLDSEGLAALVALYRHCQASGCILAMRAMPRHVRDLLELTKLNTFIVLE